MRESPLVRTRGGGCVQIIPTPTRSHTKPDTNQWEVGTLIELTGLGRSPAAQTRCRKLNSAQGRLTPSDHATYLPHEMLQIPAGLAGELFRACLGNAR